MKIQIKEYPITKNQTKWKKKKQNPNLKNDKKKNLVEPAAGNKNQNHIKTIENIFWKFKNLKYMQRIINIIFKKKKKTKFWLQISLQEVFTKKSKGIRMGKGKGPIRYYRHKIKKNENLLSIQSTRRKKETIRLLNNIKYLMATPILME